MIKTNMKNKKKIFFTLFDKLLLKKPKMINQILRHISIISEDSIRINTYYKKNFPFSYKYLFFIKSSFLIIIFLSFKHDYIEYIKLTNDILTEESLEKVVFYSKFPVFAYFFLIFYEFTLSIYIILKANSPVRNIYYEITKQVLKTTGSALVIGVGYSHAIIEPNGFSNFVHTKTPFGRGYDSEIGSVSLKVQVLVELTLVDDLKTQKVLEIQKEGKKFFVFLWKSHYLLHFLQR